MPSEGGLEDAIGKFHEAVTVAELLRRFPTAKEVDAGRHLRAIAQFQSKVGVTRERQLRVVATPTVQRMIEHIATEFNTAPVAIVVEQVELASEAYRAERLDLTDIRIWARTSHEGTRQFDFSLKALSKLTTDPAIRNAGIGKILSPQYFDCGDLNAVVAEVQQQFHGGLLNNEPPYRPRATTSNRHANALWRVANAMYESLKAASEDKLAEGISRIVGTCPWIVAGYASGGARLEKPPSVHGPFRVAQEPTPINVSMEWGNHVLQLRVKFSRGQQHGWTSLKLAIVLKEKTTTATP